MENGSHRVTLSDVYRQVESLTEQVTKLNTTAITVQDHERRLRYVERLAWMAVGVAAASAALVPIVA